MARSTAWSGWLTLASLAGATWPARADLIINVPFVHLHIRTPPRAPAPPPPPVAPAPEPAPGEPPPVPLDLDPPPPPPRPGHMPETTRKVPNLIEFAATFKPRAGAHEVVLLHPLTGGPVKVHFTLPPGTPHKVQVHRRELSFDYDRHHVAIRFFRDGGVQVRD